MRITEPAINTILQIMRKKGLDPARVKLALAVQKDALQFGFTRDRGGRKLQFGELTVLLGPGIKDDRLTIDLGEHEGRQGLLFLEGLDV